MSEELSAGWLKLQQSNPHLLSPYFHPAFTKIVAEFRNDVEVAIIEDGNTLAGFFPFQRERRTLGKPVGYPLSDYNGVIHSLDFQFDPLELLRECKLTIWDFDHLPLTQTDFARFCSFTEDSPFVDLSGSQDNYLSDRKSNGSGFRRVFQKIRKIESEIGKLSFKMDETGADQLGFIFSLKSRQYQETGAEDLFQYDWIRNSVTRLAQTKSAGFAGVLSNLYCGDALIASLLSLRSFARLHAWFPVYDRSYSAFSPGFVLHLKLIEAARGCGIDCLDFGKGDQSHKARLATGAIKVASGSVELPSWTSFRRGVNRTLRTVVKRSPLNGPARHIMNFTRVFLKRPGR